MQFNSKRFSGRFKKIQNKEITQATIQCRSQIRQYLKIAHVLTFMLSEGQCLGKGNSYFSQFYGQRKYEKWILDKCRVFSHELCEKVQLSS